MATEPAGELRADVHSIEPIPEADKDSTGPQQMWIWAGANIAPINWALGALGIVLKLGLWETIAVIVLGNVVGCAIFAAFTVMGHETGVNQMVLSWSVEDGLVGALQGPISAKLLSGADLSWLVGIVVAGGLYLALGQRGVAAAVPRAVGGGR
jgi:purine-cytosine permease-like protein